jgi:hypothetical protein
LFCGIIIYARISLPLSLFSQTRDLNLRASLQMQGCPNQGHEVITVMYDSGEDRLDVGEGARAIGGDGTGSNVEWRLYQAIRRTGESRGPHHRQFLLETAPLALGFVRWLRAEYAIYLDPAVLLSLA